MRLLKDDDGKPVLDGAGNRQFEVNGEVMPEAEFERRFLGSKTVLPPFAVESPRGWPLLSDAMAVHPTQIKEAVADAQRKGVPTEFDLQDGRAKFTSSRHFRRYLRAYGFRHHGYA